jgi:predicted oxidoreductase (fatty acid repression mutant protein)
MTRDEVLKEYGIDQWDVMADEIVRLRRILDALREPSEAMVDTVDRTLQATVIDNPHAFLSKAIRVAVYAADKEASNARD